MKGIGQHSPCGIGQHSPCGIGHNGGPPLEEFATTWEAWTWKRTQKKAWKTPPREIALRRLERAEALGMSDKDYTLEIMERGKYL